MTKIYFSEKIMINNVMPNINTASANLKSAISLGNNLVIPGDFAYASGIRNTINSLSNIRSDLSDIKQWLNDSKSGFQTVIDNLEESVSSLSSFDIETRTNFFTN